MADSAAKRSHTVRATTPHLTMLVANHIECNFWHPHCSFTRVRAIVHVDKIFVPPRFTRQAVHGHSLLQMASVASADTDTQDDRVFAITTRMVLTINSRKAKRNARNLFRTLAEISTTVSAVEPHLSPTRPINTSGSLHLLPHEVIRANPSKYDCIPITTPHMTTQTFLTQS